MKLSKVFITLFALALVAGIAYLAYDAIFGLPKAEKILDTKLHIIWSEAPKAAETYVVVSTYTDNEYNKFLLNQEKKAADEAMKAKKQRKALKPKKDEKPVEKPYLKAFERWTEAKNKLFDLKTSIPTGDAFFVDSHQSFKKLQDAMKSWREARTYLGEKVLLVDKDNAYFSAEQLTSVDKENIYCRTNLFDLLSKIEVVNKSIADYNSFRDNLSWVVDARISIDKYPMAYDRF